MAGLFVHGHLMTQEHAHFMCDKCKWESSLHVPCLCEVGHKWECVSMYVVRLWSPIANAFFSYPTRGDFWRLLINTANSLDPEQAWRNHVCSGCELFDIHFDDIPKRLEQQVRPDLDPNYLTLSWYHSKTFWKAFPLDITIAGEKKSLYNYSTCKKYSPLPTSTKLTPATFIFLMYCMNAYDRLDGLTLWVTYHTFHWNNYNKTCLYMYKANY